MADLLPPVLEQAALKPSIRSNGAARRGRNNEYSKLTDFIRKTATIAATAPRLKPCTGRAKLVVTIR
ncbi:hypothetical protein GCM10009126_28950 [Rhodanobacter caeni]|uniref:Uncharacterized protein n=1 Tax=Rhodanobacter caeni TaxID=657654 RepID=A0ABP3EF74_9GAMM